MQLTTKDVAKIFNVTERTVNEWTKKQGLRGYREGDVLHFNRSELLEWATLRGMKISDELLSDTKFSKPTVEFYLASAIENGGIFYHIQGNSKAELLRNIVNLLNLPKDADREFLYNVLFAREQMMTTAIGEGIAIPHPRSPIVLNILQPSVSICFPEKPIDYGALDGIPVHTLFTVISPSVTLHLRILARIAYVLKNEQLKAALLNRADKNKILDLIKVAETSLIS
ncbi:MAG: PTS sugar transporter subunit IIA [Verrucomicrobiae bacterium]|nr:PTS sugar transporter subunit IIA [Verrucomicrobiae bacterium]